MPRQTPRSIQVSRCVELRRPKRRDRSVPWTQPAGRSKRNGHGSSCYYRSRRTSIGSTRSIGASQERSSCPGRLKVGLDINNLLNNANVWSVTTNYGPQWGKPNQLNAGCYFTLNSQFDF